MVLSLGNIAAAVAVVEEEEEEVAKLLTEVSLSRATNSFIMIVDGTNMVDWSSTA